MNIGEKILLGLGVSGMVIVFISGVVIIIVMTVSIVKDFLNEEF